MTKSLNYFFLTFRCSQNDNSFFNYILEKYLISYFEKQTRYYWVVEDDKSLHQHFHVFYSHNGKDANASIQTLKKWIRDEIQIKDVDIKLTGNTGCINVSEKLSDDYCNKQKQDKLGYVQKDTDGRYNTNIDKSELEKHKKIYDLNEKIKEKPPEHSQKIVNIKPQTLLTYCCSFIESRNIDVDEISFENLRCLMIQDGYSFVLLNSNVELRCWQELLIRYTKLEQISIDTMMFSECGKTHNLISRIRQLLDYAYTGTDGDILSKITRNIKDVLIAYTKNTTSPYED